LVVAVAAGLDEEGDDDPFHTAPPYRSSFRCTLLLRAQS